MVTGKEFIKQILHMNNAPYFRISKGENGAIIYQNDLDGTKSINDGLNDLDQVLSVLSPGNYHMKYFREKTQGSKFMGVAFAIGNENNNNNFVNGFNQLPQPQVDVQGEIEKALLKYQTEQELKALKDENKVLKSENADLQKRLDDRITGIIADYSQYIAPHAGSFISKLIPIPNAPKQQTENVTGIYNNEELQQKIAEALNNWDEEPEIVLKAIVTLSNMQKSEPDKYNMLKNMLLNS